MMKTSRNVKLQREDPRLQDFQYGFEPTSEL